MILGDYLVVDSNFFTFFHMCRPNLLDIIFSRTIWLLKRTQKGLIPTNRLLRMFLPMLPHIFHMCKDSTAVTT